MRLQRLSFSILTLLLLLPALVSGQPGFFVQIESREVTAGQAFQVAFTARDGQAANFRPPDWNGLEVIQGPSRSMQSTFINGQMSSQTSYIFLVMAPKAGTYELGSATIELDGRVLKTEAMRLTARKGNDPTIDPDKDGEAYFIQASLDTSSACIGQQVILEYKLYTRVEINSYDIVKVPSFQGLYIRELPLFQVSTLRENMNGTEYYTRVLRKIALFPQQSGAVSIDPMIFQLGVVEKDNRTRNLFFSSRIKPVNVGSNPLELTVRKLPDPIPDDFCGAVGQFAMASQWNKTRVTTDDAVSLKLTISGDGDPKQLTAPDLDFGSAFETYPPKLIADNPSETSGRALLSKTWEYVLVPRQPGQYQLQFSLSHFAPDSNMFQQYRSEPWPLTVIKGAGTLTAEYEDREDATRKMHTPDLFDAHRPGRTLLWGTTWFWMLCSLPVAAGLVMGRVHYLKMAEDRTDPEIKRYRRASELAHKRLADAASHLETGDRGAFMKAAANAFLGYTADRLKLPVNNVRRDHLRLHLVQADVDPGLIDHFIGFWDKLDAAQYAPVMADTPLRDIYDQAVKLVSELEAALEKV